MTPTLLVLWLIGHCETIAADATAHCQHAAAAGTALHVLLCRCIHLTDMSHQG